jgi:hypothetical protein
MYGIPVFIWSRVGFVIECRRCILVSCPATGRRIRLLFTANDYNEHVSYGWIGRLQHPMAFKAGIRKTAE